MAMSSFHIATSDPLEPLLAFHRRTEKHLAQLATLAAELEGRGPGPRTSAAALSILDVLGRSTAEHHAIEEAQLLPAIERRVADAGALAEFRELRVLLHHEHAGIALAWRPLRRPLEAVAEGLQRPLDHEAIADFRALCTRHIVTEEAALHRFTLRYLPSFRQRAAA